MLSVQNLSISLDDKQLLALSFDIPAGEVLTLMGPSGSGKSTLLYWLIGALQEVFEASGEAFLNQQAIHNLATEQRKIGLLFQDDLLFPHMTVGDNLSFALPSSSKSSTNKQARRELIETTLNKAGLENTYERDPATLSGGQRARVSLLQVLLAEPQAILLDEPFSKLDSDLRQQFRQFVYAQIAELNIPALLVTHDKDDVPANGRIINLGTNHAR